MEEEDGEMAAEGRSLSEQVQPRLMISKIVCTNFKSYAGVRELGPFHKAHTRTHTHLHTSIV